MCSASVYHVSEKLGAIAGITFVVSSMTVAVNPKNSDLRKCCVLKKYLMHDDNVTGQKL